MSDYKIRGYKDWDYETARELFSAGMNEYVPSVCVHVLKQPWVLFVLMCMFLCLLVSSKSLILPLLSVTLALALGRQLLGYCWSLYIDHCLKEDLRDISKTYVQSQGSYFWVAEARAAIRGGQGGEL
ncbi:hypothetical protein XELAEV_18004888mg [Xenopus laevis]|uniref:Uncharacterized protein n=1 Tax=Xenopus laevis TaxID=8355 RepID=A0A974DWJ4_XENLA|nr:hypothetical protein XELAEV_18004888mg [Xenopus laevis]